MERHIGTLKAWKDNKGFGFIRPETGGKDVFVHIRDFGSIPRQPRVGDTIYFQPLRDREGRLRAGDVEISGVARGTKLPKPNTQRHQRASGNKAGQRRLLSAIRAIVLIGILIGVGYNTYQTTSIFAPRNQVSTHATNSDVILRHAFQDRKSNLQVMGNGTVVRILPDDNDGSRHQKFILRLASGQTLLIAHNIDIAPRIRGLDTGDSVSFNGEYEWNRQGGVVHWTHKDPARRHESGWLKHEGQSY